MKRALTIVLVIVAIASFAGALYYPIHYHWEKDTNESELDELRAIRKSALQSADSSVYTGEARDMETSQADPTVTEGPSQETSAQTEVQTEAQTEVRTGSAAPVPKEMPLYADDRAQPVIPARTDATEYAPSAEEMQPTAAPQTISDIPAGQAVGDTASKENGTEASGTMPSMSDAGARVVQNTTFPPDASAKMPSGGTPQEDVHAQDIASGDARQPLTTPDIPAAATGPVGQAAVVGKAFTDDAAVQPDATDEYAPEAPAQAQAAADVTANDDPHATLKVRMRGAAVISAEPMPYGNEPPVPLDQARILPQYMPLWRMNADLVGWLLIEDIGIDYPVMQTPGDNEYYLHRSFSKEPNSNGQLILDEVCDPYTPSYNLIIYGHNMNSGAMFGELDKYKDIEFWKKHKLLRFDSLMEERLYVVTACFYGAEVAEGQEGFRYAVDFRDDLGYREWIKQLDAAKCYDTGVDCRFGDQFVTLSTCAYHQKNGRFVVVARRVRADETFENEP
ncbi:MAG: sortase [Clostridiales bacterium]|nr:sortase [Clostridiales bacterium]